jgi:hypothetical protein
MAVKIVWVFTRNRETKLANHTRLPTDRKCQAPARKAHWIARP